MDKHQAESERGDYKRKTDKCDIILDLLPVNNNVQLSDYKDDAINIISDIGTTMSKDISTIEDNIEQYNEKSIVLHEQCDKVQDNVELHLSSNDKNRTSRMKRKKREITELNAEENIQIKRIKQIMQ
ncbi:uncharacterized protein LOC105185090 [Harpegnathos saltator]|uniref:uncharacterized protein LOC105185090 n=1 Tax=Harpegnathos saltator TaxID=610380 RepID=UPI000591809A|nr:uncharacterized protein LOC105185090 [Harpegnathos saltator]XP_011142635.1 uncharacterized protein LOC105185090 [Harpegnathos saltator]